MRRLTIGLLGVSTLLEACGGQSAAQNEADANAAAPGAQSQPAKLSLTRLDCGSATIKNFDKFFSDKPGLYENGPRDGGSAAVGRNRMMLVKEQPGDGRPKHHHCLPKTGYPAPPCAPPRPHPFVIPRPFTLSVVAG